MRDEVQQSQVNARSRAIRSGLRSRPTVPIPPSSTIAADLTAGRPAARSRLFARRVITFGASTEQVNYKFLDPIFDLQVGSGSGIGSEIDSQRTGAAEQRSVFCLFVSIVVLEAVRSVLGTRPDLSRCLASLLFRPRPVRITTNGRYGLVGAAARPAQDRYVPGVSARPRAARTRADLVPLRCQPPLGTGTGTTTTTAAARAGTARNDIDSSEGRARPSGAQVNDDDDQE